MNFHIWFHFGELIPCPKLILDKLSHVWFHIKKEPRIDSEFIIDYELKQLWVAYALDKKNYVELYS